MDLPFHFRALDKNGVTLRQSTAAYPTFESAKEFSDAATHMTGLKHVVCESIDYKDPRNDPKKPLQHGYVICDARKAVVA